MLQSVLLLGLLLVQDPTHPQDATRPQDPARPVNATIDPELRAAVDALKRATGYNFHVDGSCNCAITDDKTLARADASKPADTAARTDNVAHAKERSDVRHDVRLDGTFERSKPVHLVGSDFEAYRLGDKIVYKTKDGADWMLLSRTRGQLGTDPKSGANSAGGKGDVTADKVDARAIDDREMGAMHARIPAPSDLLDDLDSNIVSCTRVTGDRASGAATFECVVRPRAGSPLTSLDISPPPPGAPASATSVSANQCKLRVTVKNGAIDELTLESRAAMSERISGGNPPAGNPPSEPNPGKPPVPPTAPTPQNTPPARGEVVSAGACDIRCSYRITDLNGASVTVPEQVQRLLER